MAKITLNKNTLEPTNIESDDDGVMINQGHSDDEHSVYIPRAFLGVFIERLLDISRGAE